MFDKIISYFNGNWYELCFFQFLETPSLGNLHFLWWLRRGSNQNFSKPMCLLADTTDSQQNNLSPCFWEPHGFWTEILEQIKLCQVIYEQSVILRKGTHAGSLHADWPMCLRWALKWRTLGVGSKMEMLIPLHPIRKQTRQTRAVANVP